MQPEDALRIIQRPYVTEKTFDMIERQNKMVFLVDGRSSKGQIRWAIETLYDVEVDSVNTSITVTGKKAYVRLAPGSSASDLASKLGLV